MRSHPLLLYTFASAECQHTEIYIKVVEGVLNEHYEEEFTNLERIQSRFKIEINVAKLCI